ncbi:MAG: hypothetical protein ACI9PY_001291 [Ascidiaceihabitans sp.]|jgi:uncharacterized protein (DUF924 family)
MVAMTSEVLAGPEEVLRFWLDECDPADWYMQNDALDKTIRDKFLGTLNAAASGTFSLWLTYPSGALAYIVLTDQFSRNIYRDSGKAFATDRMALMAAKSAIDKGWDMRIDEPARQFFYMPLMHSESLCDQDRCVRLMCDRLPQDGSNLLHARAHRQVIRQFGRFPYRNDVLGRKSLPSEVDYVAAGGYGSTVRVIQAKAA